MVRFGLAIAAVPALVAACSSARSDTNATTSRDGVDTVPNPAVVGASPATSSPSSPAAAVADASIAAFDSLYSKMVDVHNISRRAVDAQVSPCVQEAGLEYVPIGNDLEDDPERRRRLPWNSPDAVGAAEQGYVAPGTAVADSGSTEPLVDPRYEAVVYGDVIGSWSIDPATATYDGQPIGGDIRNGCLPPVATEIIGGGEARSSAQVLDAYYQLTFWFRQAIDTVITDPGFIERQVRWSKCMRSQGFTYDTLDDPQAAAWPEPRPSIEEIRTASADWACKNEVGIAQFGDEALDREIGERLDAAQLEVQALIEALDGVEARSIAALQAAVPPGGG